MLVDFARNLVTDYDIEEMLDTLCREALMILGVSGAGVMLTDARGDLRFVAASDDTVREIEALQIEMGEGPCLRAYETGEAVVEPDLDEHSRFPQFAPRAVKAGLRGVYSFPMSTGSLDEQVGALNLYTAEPGRFDEAARRTGQVLAHVATTYILNARAFARSQRLTSQLQHALDTRVVVEQAKGKVSEQLGVEVPEAFERMRQYARSNRMKVHDVARRIIEDRLRLGEP